MKYFQPKISAIALAVATMGGFSATSMVYAQESASDAPIEEIVTIGSRRQARSASDTVAPVDVINAKDITDLSLIHI